MSNLKQRIQRMEQPGGCIQIEVLPHDLGETEAETYCAEFLARNGDAGDVMFVRTGVPRAGFAAKQGASALTRKAAQRAQQTVANGGALPPAPTGLLGPLVPSVGLSDDGGGSLLFERLGQIAP